MVSAVDLHTEIPSQGKHGRFKEEEGGCVARAQSEGERG